MIETLKNKDGLIYCYIEWQILDAAGYQQTNGDYIYIKNMWIHEDWRETRAFNQVIKKINDHPYSQKAGFVYWEIVRDSDGVKIIEEEEREHKTKRLSKIFNKKYIVNKILKGDANVLTKIKQAVLAG